MGTRFEDGIGPDTKIVWGRVMDLPKVNWDGDPVRWFGGAAGRGPVRKMGNCQRTKLSLSLKL